MVIRLRFLIRPFLLFLTTGCWVSQQPMGWSRAANANFWNVWRGMVLLLLTVLSATKEQFASCSATLLTCAFREKLEWRCCLVSTSITTRGLSSKLIRSTLARFLCFWRTSALWITAETAATLRSRIAWAMMMCRWSWAIANYVSTNLRELAHFGSAPCSMSRF